MTSKRGVVSLALRMPGWVYAIFLLIGLAIAIPALVMFERAARLEWGGLEVQGQVTKLWQGTQSCGQNDMSTCATYNVAYGFDAGGWRVTEVQVAADQFATLQEGGPIAVRYVVDDPTINEADFGWTFFGGLLFLIFALVFGGFGGFALRGRWRVAQAMVTVRDTGVERQAEVTSHDATRMRVNNTRQATLSWRDTAGVTGKSQAQAEAGLPPVGASLTVYADPTGILPSVWQGDCGAR